MILIDSRVGSKEFAPLIPDSHISQLEYADFAFSGNGPDGLIMVGVERKAISDVLACLYDGRFSGHQLPGLLANYNEIYLIVEGMYKCDINNGIVKVRRGKNWVPANTGKGIYTVKGLLSFLNTLSIITGIHIFQTSSKLETAQYIKTIYDWWQKEWDDHKSHLQRHKTTGTLLVKQPLKRRIAAELSGIGHTRSEKVANHFGSVHEMINATVEQWLEIDGIGKTIANSIVKEINKEDK